MTLFNRANLRHLWRQPLQVLLSVAGIALGVAVVLAVDLANHNALQAFRLSEQAVSGEATHSIVPVSGVIRESFYRDLRLDYGFRQSTPSVTGSVATVSGRALQVLGIDPLATAAFTTGATGPRTQLDAGTLIGVPGATMLTESTAATLAVSVGDTLRVVAGGRRHELPITGLLKGEGPASEGLRGVLIMDVSSAQVLLDRTGGLSRIDLKLSAPEIDGVEALLPASLELRPVDSRSSALAHMARAFQINLTALGLLALVIGAFLIYNTQTLFVLNRRESFAVWRTLGVTRSQVMIRVLSEAFWLALAGGVVGCLAGTALSLLLLDLVARTINDLYFPVEIRSMDLSAASIAKALGLGVGAALLATAVPALEAAGVQPRLALSRSQLESTAGRIRRTGPLVAGTAWLAATVVLAASGQSIVAGFVGLFFIVAGFACLVPVGLRWITRYAVPVLRKCFGWIGVWSARNILASMSRTQIAVTALTIALAATIGVSVMIQSFRLTVVHWLDNYLRADIYISHADESGPDITDALLQRLRERPDTAAVSTGRWVRLSTRREPTRLFVLDTGMRGFESFQLVKGTHAAAWPAFSTGDAVIVSESYAYHRSLTPGSEVRLPTGQAGERLFTVIDTFYDYASDRGTVVMHRDVYDRYWDDSVIESMAVYLAPGVDGDEFLQDIESGALRGTGLVGRSNTRIKKTSLEVFDRTFTVTEVLRFLTIIVACIGILSALIAIQLDRTREFAVLRASGLTRGEMSRVMMIEGGIMGTAAAVLSIPLGLVLAAVLVFVINKRSFGWSMQFAVSWEQAAVALALGLLAGVAAAAYPAWCMSRQLPIIGLRYE